MSYGPALPVEGQPRQNLPYGLFSALNLRESSDPHWKMGITWRGLTCSPASAISDPDCETEIDKFFRESGVDGEATPFVVYGSSLCGTPGGRSFETAQEEATAHLLAGEQTQAEFQVWTRLLAASTGLPGSAVSPEVGLARLEAWLGYAWGSAGVIHAPREVASLLDNNLETKSDRLLTNLGTPVIAGAGYSLYQAGDAPATRVMLASPPLFGYRGGIFDSSQRPGDLLDRGRNDLYAVAEREYVVGFDPCGVAAIEVTIE
jgi:hypothetical protein